MPVPRRTVPAMRTTSKTHEEYFAALAEPRQGELRALHALIRESAPDLAPTMEFGMPGYGRYHYRYASGREGDAATVSTASSKNASSLYELLRAAAATPPAGAV